MNSIDKLAEIFTRFPGIGPRQARRFVYFLLTREGGYVKKLVESIQNLKKEIAQCQKCMRFFACNGRRTEICDTCVDDSRDTSMLMVVSRDIDFETMEKSGSYNGLYFVLGGVVPILEKEPEKRIRIKSLEARIKNDKNLKEIILATSANLDGENTAEFIKQRCQRPSLTFSILGRGLSTGAELEYADPETLKNALLHRTK